MRYDVGRFRRPMRRSTEGQLMSLISLGDGSTLTLDFTTGVLDSRLTFTRASTATFINSSGLVASASTNVARFDHDPTTLQPRGLLIEGSATNVLLGFAAGAWGRQNIDGSGTGGALTNGQTGPGGVANTAARITTAASTTFPTGMFVAFATNAAGNSRTFSVWLRGVGANTTASIAINGSKIPAGVASSQSGHSVTLATSTSGNNLLALVTGLSTTAWTRVSISRTDTQASSDSYRICPGNHTSTISSGLAVDVYVPQAESGIGMSSTIPTVASQVTRVADSAVMNDIASLNYSATNGTIYWSGIINKQPTSSSTLIGFMTAIDQPTYETFGNALNYFTTARGPSLNAGGLNEVAHPYVLGSLIKYASSVNTLVNPIVAVNLNGSAGSVNKSGTGDMHVATRFVLGRQPSSTYGANYPSVTIRDIKYWPTTKTAAELAVLTA